MTPEELRKSILRKRNNLDPVSHEEFSLRLVIKILQHPAFKRAELILGYSPVKSEVETRTLLQQALHMGKRVALPVSRPQSRKLDFYTLDSLNDLIKGTYGICEPPQLDEKLVSKYTKALILVPGSVFDSHGNRMGWGKGYYDRFLAQLPRSAFKMGIGFNCQLVKKIKPGLHDIAMDEVITEK